MPPTLLDPIPNPSKSLLPVDSGHSDLQPRRNEVPGLLDPLPGLRYSLPAPGAADLHRGWPTLLLFRREEEPTGADVHADEAHDA